MNEKTQKAFGIFWDRIGHAENMIFDHTGPRYPPFVKENMDESFLKAYEDIKQALKPLANKRLFIGPPEAPGYPVFGAETAHEALMFILNPPEVLFGLPQVLTNKRYIKIKDEALEESSKVLEFNIDTKPKPLEGNVVSRPKWDGNARKLLFGNIVCKKYRQPAYNQISILESFEKASWPDCIKDPLGTGPDNATRQRTSDAVRALNKNNKGIKFELAGDKEHILWEPL
jgi:hypothetical protein